ncbi:HAD domain-containing protein [Cryobacterium sp. N19]|uniref:HAD domain-containing protein n=1 Tax=Cryobacterium sp. N19 TaxID=2048288 RepID=UPI001304E375|nr:HAD domain-containing protein [Cryobacterium sp. N19]
METKDQTSAIRPRLYLDVDGCLCPFRNPDPAWGAVKRTEVTLNYGGGMAAKYKLIWAPPLIVALEALREEFGLELVWLTTWNELDAARDKLVPRFQGLAGGRVLEFTPGPLKPGEARGYWKAQRLLEDQASDPGPFIWIDDAEVELHGWKVLAATVGTPSLLIPPNSMVGLRVDEVERMRVWLQTTRLEG